VPGADTVLGIDISSKMIELAEAEEKRNPIGCKFLCMDATKVGLFLCLLRFTLILL
jgi:hypothetical protein